MRWLARISAAQRSMALLVVSAALLLCMGCQQGGSLSEADLDLHKQLAGELRDNGLFEAAIEEYRTILEYSGLTRSQQANINYLIGRVYYDDLKDYHSAAAFYLRARALDPEGSWMAEASKNLVASLQKIGNLVDAKRELNVATGLNSQPQSDDDKPIARIGGEPVYRSEIDRAISKLPAEVQERFITPQGKVQFVREYVGLELLHRAAVRENYQSNPDIVQRSEDVTRQLMIEKFVIDNVMTEVDVDTVDIRNFYRAHKTDRYADKPFDSIKAQVFLDYQQEKAQVAYSEYLNELMKNENVIFLDQNWR